MPNWFKFLSIEADLAMTFIGVADTPDLEKSAQCLASARKALAQIRHGLGQPIFHGLDEDQIAFLEMRCTEVESALAAFELSN